MKQFLVIFLVVVSAFFSPYTWLSGAAALAAWFAVRLVGSKERALVVVCTGTLLFWVLYLASGAWYPQTGRAVTTAGFPLPMYWMSTNRLDTALSRMLRENALVYFADYALALAVMLLASKPLERFFMPAGKSRGVWYAIVALTPVTSAFGFFVFAASIS